MATENYMAGRKQYKRPQALLFANNSGYLSEDTGARIPEGNEFEDFIIISDDNRAAIDIQIERIENKQRTVNGRMRSYHIADKINISTSWENFPSRAFSVVPTFTTGGAEPGEINNLVTSTNVKGTVRPVKSSGSPFFKDQQYTSDGGAGGADLLEWYRNNQGSFWIYLSYDNHYNLGNERDRLREYSEIVEVFFNSFDYSVQKRGGDNHDLWTVSLSLAEV